MEKFIIQDWGSGTHLELLPSSIKYVELYDANNVIMNDNYVFTIDVVNVVQLEYENFEGAAFPLQLYAFDKNEMDSGEPLFNLPSGFMAAQARLAIGKRHELVKNVETTELFDFINDYAFEYVTKRLDGLDAETARTNLDVYSTEETDDKLNVGFFTNATPVVTQSVSSKIICTERPYDRFYVTTGLFRTHSQAGAVYVSLHCKGDKIINGSNLNTNQRIYKLCKASDIVGAAYIPNTLVVGTPASTSLPQLPVTGYYVDRLPESYANKHARTFGSLIADPSTKEAFLPLLLITPNAAVSFCGTALEANSIYLYRNSIAPHVPIPGQISYLLFDWEVDIKYDVVYYPVISK